MDTHVYIDGFNLFYGLLKGSPHKWLDLEQLCDKLFPKNKITKILYFTARVDARAMIPTSRYARKRIFELWQRYLELKFISELFWGLFHASPWSKRTRPMLANGFAGQMENQF